MRTMLLSALALLVVGLPLTATALAPLAAPAPQAELLSGPVTMSVIPGFSPPVVVTGAGSSILFHNTDAVAHTVTALEGGNFNAFLLPGQSVTIAFPSAGVVAYHCAIHSWMVGTVVVS